jgi:hypothetical protein
MTKSRLKLFAKPASTFASKMVASNSVASATRELSPAIPRVCLRASTPTGRTIVLNVPLTEDETRLGDVMLRIEPDGTIIVPKASLVQQLAPVLDRTSLTTLEKLPDKNGMVSLGDLSNAKFRLTYNPTQMELEFHRMVECTMMSAPFANLSTWSEVEDERGGARVSLPASPPITTLPAGVSTR